LTFPRYRDAQIAVPMNQGKLSFLMRSRSVDGRALETMIEGIAEVEKRYTNPNKGVASSVLGRHAPFLNPSPANPLLRIKPATEEIHVLLERYLGLPLKKLALSQKSMSPSSEQIGRIVTTAALSEDDLRHQLERQSETGRAGEFLVIQDELARLTECGCPDPERYVHRISQSDVGRGYDIESVWPGEERCIEVKTTTRAGSDFFLTANERAVLGELGERAWIYRVEADGNHDGKIVARLNNPMRKIAEAQMTPVVWRVPNCVFDDEG
jgi:hypothetical protein